MKEFTPYLNFDGNCREAMTFYQQCLGGEMYTMSFGEAGFGKSPEEKERLVHARLKNGATTIMASDTMGDTPFVQGNSVWVNLWCDTDEEVDTLYPKLSEGGQEIMGQHDAFWGARFAMFVDRFGVRWMLNHDRSGAM